jgi:hypothetical protein
MRYIPGSTLPRIHQSLNRFTDLAFGLLFTSTQIHNEASEMFFKLNHFLFETIFDMHKFLSTTGEKTKFIQSVTLNPVTNKYPLSLADSIVELCIACPSIKYLEMIYDFDPKIYTESMIRERWLEVKESCKLKEVRISLLSKISQYFGGDQKARTMRLL